MTHDPVGKGRRVTACQVFTSSIQICATLAFCSGVGCSTEPAAPSPADTSNELASMQSSQHMHAATPGTHTDDADALHCEVTGEHAAVEPVDGEHLLHCEHVAVEPVAGEHVHEAHALNCEHVAGEHVASDHAAGEQVHEVYLHCVHHVAGEQAHEVHLHCEHFADEHILGDQVHDAHVLHCAHVMDEHAQ